MQTNTDQKTIIAQSPTQKAAPWGKKTAFTVEEAAAFMEVRADDLTAMLPAAGIDLNTRHDGILTSDDIKRLETLVRDVRQIPSESVYGGGNL